MKRLILVASFVGAFTSSATDYWWGKGSDGSYSGAIDAGDHWHAGSTTGTSGIVPNVGDRMFLGRDVSSNYTVTMPDGVYTNFARLTASIYAAHSLTVDCSRTVFRHPKNTEGVYNAEPLAFYYNDYVSSIFGLNLNNATSPDATATTAPHLEISNTVIRATSPATKRMRLEFDGGGANLYNVLGHAWTSTIYPRLYVFQYNNNGASTGAPKTDFSEVVFTNGCSLAAPNLCLQGNSWTNVFRLNGGTHSCSACQIPARYDGQPISEYPTLTDLIVENDARFTVGGTLNLGPNANATNRINRLIARDGGVMTVAGVEGKYGHHQLIADGGTIELGLGNQNLRPNDQMTLDIQVSNGGKIVMNQQGNGRGAYIGYVSEKELVTMGVTNATYETKTSGKGIFYDGRIGFKDALINNAGTLRFGGGMKPVEMTIIDSVISNKRDFCIGGDGACNLAISGSKYYGDLCLGQISMAAASFAFTGRVEAVETDFDLGSGKLYVGYQPKMTGVFNLRSGSVVSTSGVGVSVGYCGSGEMNVFGGSVKAYQASVAGTGSDKAETAVGEESVLRILGGEFCIGAQGEDEFIGLAVADSSLKTRRGRLVMNGGVLESCATFGGICAASRGGSGFAAFEADGGILRAPCDSSHLLHHFDEAKVGAKGLVIDNAGYDVTVEQTIADKTDAVGVGRIAIVGKGAVRLTGDLGGLGVLLANEGTVDLSELGGSELGSLVATNTAILKLDPSKTISLKDVLGLANLHVAFSTDVNLGETYDLFSYEAAMTDVSREDLANAIAVAGVPTGASVVFNEVAANGGYVLRATVREIVNMEISAMTSETRTDDISYLAADQVTAMVAHDATLTLLGKTGKGHFKKVGEGTLNLSNMNNLFVGGFSLLDGRLVANDPMALGLGKLGNGKVSLVNGVLRFAGVGDADYGDLFVFGQNADTNHVILDAQVNAKMALPPSITNRGGVTKRGPGRITFEVEGDNLLVDGNGTHDVSKGFWSERKGLVYPQIFDETTGLLTNGTFGAFNICEGEVRIVGKGENARISRLGAVCLALPTSSGDAMPGLWLDNVSLFNQAGTRYFFIASCLKNSTPVVADFANEPYLVLTNGSALEVGTFYCNRLNDNPNQRTKVDVSSGSTLTASTLSPNRSQNADSRADWCFRDAKLYAGTISLFHDFTMTLDNTVCAKNENLEELTIKYEVDTSSGTTCLLDIRNGSTFYCTTIKPPTKSLTSYHPITLKFDDAAWIPAKDADYTFEWDEPEKILILVENTGLVLPVPANRTWTMNQPVKGEGGLVQSGEGTLVLGEDVVQYAGVTRCVAGTVDLAGRAVGLVAGGAGTFTHGTIAGGGIAVNLDDEYRTGDVPIFDGISFSGRTAVDLGRTVANPLPQPFRSFTVGIYVGETPNVSGFKLKGTGLSNVRGVFAAENGVITCKPELSGLILIVH